MPLVHLPAGQHANVAWKNGLGMSKIIANEPPDAGYDALRWQVASTEITADCPFSALPGLDRQFMVIEGAGVELTSIDDDGMTRKVQVRAMRSPYAFRGDWKTDCRLLDGQVRVLNILCRRGMATASVVFLDGETLSKAAGETAIAVDLDSLDARMLSGPGRERAAIEPHPGTMVLIRITA